MKKFKKGKSVLLGFLIDEWEPTENLDEYIGTIQGIDKKGLYINWTFPMNTTYYHWGQVLDTLELELFPEQLLL